jgi:predicted regulator of Ras-like GTPase activity (Roadblock/LC7/MglB family)
LEGAQVSTAQHPVQDLDWLVTDFAERVRHVAHAVVVSADGLVRASSAMFPRDLADQVAAVTSALTSLTQGAARTFQAGEVIQMAVQMEDGLLVTMLVSNGSTLTVLAAAECDLGHIAYEMSLLAERVERELTPASPHTYGPESPLPAVPPQAKVKVPESQ